MREAWPSSNHAGAFPKRTLSGGLEASVGHSSQGKAALHIYRVAGFEGLMGIQLTGKPQIAPGNKLPISYFAAANL